MINQKSFLTAGCFFFLAGCTSFEHYGTPYEFEPPVAKNLRHFEIINAKGHADPQNNDLSVSYVLKVKTLKDENTVIDEGDFCDKWVKETKKSISEHDKGWNVFYNIIINGMSGNQIKTCGFVYRTPKPFREKRSTPL